MKTIDIFGKLVSKLKGGYVASADQVYDETLGKFQSEINQGSDVESAIDGLVDKMPPSTQSYIKSGEWTEFPYDGQRIEAPSPQRIAAGVYGDAVRGQALAIYGDKLFRLADGGGLGIYKFVDGGFQHLAKERRSIVGTAIQSSLRQPLRPGKHILCCMSLVSMVASAM